MANYDSVLTGLELDSAGAGVKNATTGYSGVGAAQTLNDWEIGPSGSGWLKVNNLKLDGNEISSMNTDGDIELTPDGTGLVKTGNLALKGGSNTIVSTDTDGNIIFEPDGNGSIILEPTGAGVVQGLFHMFCHNFADDAGTDENYLPWTDATESVTAGGRKGFLAMHDMVLKQISWRHGSANPHTMTIRVESCASEDPFTAGNIATIATATRVHDGTDHKVYSRREDDFNVQPKVPAGSIAVMTMQGDVDVNAASTDWLISSIWSLE